MKGKLECCGGDYCDDSKKPKCDGSKCVCTDTSCPFGYDCENGECVTSVGKECDLNTDCLNATDQKVYEAAVQAEDTVTLAGLTAKQSYACVEGKCAPVPVYCSKPGAEPCPDGTFCSTWDFTHEGKDFDLSKCIPKTPCCLSELGCGGYDPNYILGLCSCKENIDCLGPKTQAVAKLAIKNNDTKTLLEIVQNQDMICLGENKCHGVPLTCTNSSQCPWGLVCKTATLDGTSVSKCVPANVPFTIPTYI